MARYYFRREISHPGLKKYQVISAASPYELEQKAQAKLAQWDAQWQRKLATEKRAAERAKKAQDAEEAMRIAQERSEEAESIQNALDTILVSSIDEPEFDFTSLKDYSPYPYAAPQCGPMQGFPKEPLFENEKYHPKASFMTKLSRQKMEAFEAENRAAFEADHAEWRASCEEISKTNAQIKQAFESATTQWNKQKAQYESEQAANNEKADQLQAKMLAGDQDAVADLVELAIDSLDFPIEFETQPAAQYNSDEKSLVLDIFLPTIDDIPDLKSVSYIKSRNEFKESTHSAAHVKKKYESVVYQIVLRVVKRVFALGGNAQPIQSLVLNGRVDTIDKATGNNITPCVLSLSTTREAFEQINLESVDPKTWFKSSKGVSAASIANVTPVAPIVQLSREDRRFIEGYSVEDTLDESVNLAAMDWQDFENLIRELFEKEFSAPGGEVKITQASRDGGVDAVAFDPDPIRGGKIVIQAKRYTNTVGVSAVRDLYGTVMNEGAMKGILVTTANFGNDAYEFAQGKPLTLMNGANLLYLLERHGRKAKIDLKEAKELLSN